MAKKMTLDDYRNEVSEFDQLCTKLTPRETEVMLLMCKGLSNKAMADYVHGFVPNPNDGLNLRGVTIGRTTGDTTGG